MEKGSRENFVVRENVEVDGRSVEGGGNGIVPERKVEVENRGKKRDAAKREGKRSPIVLSRLSFFFPFPRQEDREIRSLVPLPIW